MTYFSFIAANRGLLAFGFLAAFFSSQGQTFFISMFNGELRAVFDLSHGEFGSLYSAATLTSAALMVQAGQLIDRIDLRRFSIAVVLLFAGACFYMATLPELHIAFLFIAILALRFFGQGMMSHISVTSMARYFEAGRGRALALASLGHAGGEAVFPLLTVALLGVMAWQSVWALYAGVLVFIFVPLIWRLLSGHAERHSAMLAETAAREATGEATRQWSRAEVLRDPLFWFILPQVMAPAFINTGIFFNQVHLTQVKGWGLEVFATGFVVYAVATVIAALVMGPITDRLGARKLFPLTELSLAAGLLLLASSADPVALYGFMALAGLSTGAFNTVSNAFWAEVYGRKHLGAIRALAVSIMVLATALSPAVMGNLLDVKVTMDTILFGCAAYVLASALLATKVWRGEAAKQNPRV